MSYYATRNTPEVLDLIWNTWENADMPRGEYMDTYARGDYFCLDSYNYKTNSRLCKCSLEVFRSYSMKEVTPMEFVKEAFRRHGISD